MGTLKKFLYTGLNQPADTDCAASAKMAVWCDILMLGNEKQDDLKSKEKSEDVEAVMLDYSAFYRTFAQRHDQERFQNRE
jgi:hypothetical protein